MNKLKVLQTIARRALLILNPLLVCYQQSALFSI